MAAKIYEFGAYRLDTGERTLWRNGTRVALAPKALEILLCLVRNAGHVVEKDAVMREVWPDTFVEEGNLGQQIFHIRRALGQDGGGVEYIETIPRRGYRFQAAVQLAGATRDQSPARTRYWIYPGIAALALAVAAFAYSILHAARPPSAAFTLRPLTAYPGIELFPALSPDGSRFAFTWKDAHSGQVDLYVREVNAEPPLRLTNDPMIECYPAWSPDGSMIAFLSCQSPTGAIDATSDLYVVSALGGPARRIATVDERIPLPIPPLCWSADGKEVIIRDATPNGRTLALYRIDIESAARRQLTFPSETFNDAAPAVSPSGRMLAFVRESAANPGDIFIIDLEKQNAPARQITHAGDRILTVAWHSERQLIYLSNMGAVRRLWRVPLDSSKPQSVASLGQTGIHFSLTRGGTRVAYSDAYEDTDIEWVDLAETPLEQSVAGRPIIESSGYDVSPQYSPDGRRIAFASDRSGEYEIWTANADGNAQRQVTFWKGSTGTPRWSPDGKEIAADSQQLGGPTDIFVVGASGGSGRKLTHTGRHNFVPSWSRDGQFIYFASDRSGELQIWKTPAHPDDEGDHAVQVTKRGGFNVFESFDGSRLYYTKQAGSAHAIWTVLANGGDERPILDPVAGWAYWTLMPDGFYFSPLNQPLAVWFYRFADQKTRAVATLKRPFGAGFSVSSDRRFLLYAPGTIKQGHVYLIDDFR